MIYTLKARTLRKIKNNKAGQEIYADLIWLYDEPKLDVGDIIELEYYKDAPVSHQAEIISKCNGGYYIYIPDEQPKCVTNIYQNK